MYEPPPDERAGCRETFILTRAAYAVLIPIFLLMVAVLSLVLVMLFLLITHPLLALLPLAALVGGVMLYARWERRRFRPPGP